MNSPIESPQSNKTPNSSPSTTFPMIIYTLYLISFTIPFTALIAIIMAYLNKTDENNFLQSHSQFQIRTFWIGLLYITIGSIIGLILSFVFIGLFILVFYIIWFIIRCIKGLIYLNKKQPIPNPTSWMFG
ncbi:hypothetical protein MNBD_GAMMA04-2120 [hydrothermal vent metagenome]|uniref:Transmembrane protein n=1 Tax=hydrothermal vent metagenome TaxID=652676 RepID=A0A3B0WHD4_9ZZZZ